jgi:hypothetical protein
MSADQRERTETLTVGDLTSIRSIRPNSPNEYFGLSTFRSLILAVLPTSKVEVQRGRPASRGVMTKDDLFEIAKKHLGHAFGRLDRQIIKGPKGGVVRWKRTMAWAKVTLQRKGSDPRVVQRGKWIVLCDPRVTETRWIAWALLRKKKRCRRRRRRGPYSLRKKARARNIKTRTSD